jgi:transposase, IS5 family
MVRFCFQPQKPQIGFSEWTRLKSDGHLGRNYINGRLGNHTNAVLSAVGHNLRLILKWLRLLLYLILAAIRDTVTPLSALKPAS